MTGHVGSGRTGKVLKAMGMFSGVQFVTLASGIVRTKLVAIWIGTLGVGLFGIYNSTIDLVTTFILLGIGTSAVRNIANSRTPETVAETTAVLRRWGVMLGLLGFILLAALSPLLSRQIFGDSNHTLAFALIGLCVFLNGLNAAQTATMQGTRQLKNLARATVTGMVTGVLLSLPLFYWVGAPGIPPAIVICSICTVLAARRFGNFPKYTGRMSLKKAWREGSDFVRVGFFIMLSQAVTLAATFLFIAWLTNHAGTDVTGEFQAGFTLYNRYVGLVFVALSVEFYPRLAAQHGSRNRMSVLTSHELLLVCALLMPLLAIFSATVPVVVRILYSEAFLAIVPFVTLSLSGIVMRAFSWCLGFSMIAHGHGRTMIVTESTSAILYLCLNIAGWLSGGLEGLGWAYIIWYSLYSVLVAFIYFKVYNQHLTRTAILLSIVTLICVAASSALALTGLWWVSLILTLPASVPLIIILKKIKK